MLNGKALASILTLTGIGVVGVVWANWHRGVTVILHNADAVSLSDITIHVTGHDYPIGDIPPGFTKHVLVDPTADSHIEISQRLADGRERLPVECYFESGYSGTITIAVSTRSATVVDNQIAVGLW